MFAVRRIGVPVIAAVDETDRFAVPDIIRKHEHFGIAVNCVMRIELVFERPKSAQKAIWAAGVSCWLRMAITLWA